MFAAKRLSAFESSESGREIVKRPEAERYERRVHRLRRSAFFLFFFSSLVAARPIFRRVNRPDGVRQTFLLFL